MIRKLVIITALLAATAAGVDAQTFGKPQAVPKQVAPRSRDARKAAEKEKSVRPDLPASKMPSEELRQRISADTSTVRPNYPLADYSRPQKYVIRDITIHGAQGTDPVSVVMYSGMRLGEEIYIPGSYVSAAIKNFWNRSLFSNIEIAAEMVGDSVNLDIYFSERPVVVSWKFEGIRKSEVSDLTESLELKRGRPLSDFMMTNNINSIHKFFEEKGFRNVKVDPVITSDTTSSRMPNAIAVTYEIQKGPKVKIGEITFSGNEEFSDSRLRKTLKKTHKTSINIFKSTRLKTKEYEEDKNGIIDFYNSKGFRNAMITGDSIYDINNRRIGVHIDLEEGNKYYFRNITWVGNSVYPTEQLSRMLGIEKGDMYDKKTLNKRLGIGAQTNPDDMTAISSLYQNNGYIFSAINPSEVIIGADSIDLEIKIFEGSQARINEVRITGNHRVNDEVIRRELATYPGELYNRSLLMETMRLLNQMQHFNPEAMAPQPIPVTAELVDINWPLEERASDQAEISGGWGAGTFVASVGLVLNNFSVKNMFKKGAWRPYPQGQNQQVRLKVQTNGSYYKQFSLSFLEPWLGGKKPNSLSVSAHYSDETNAYYFWDSGTQHFKTLGLSVGVGRRLNWPDRWFTLYNEISYESYMLKDWNYFILTNGHSNIFTFTTIFGRNSIDQPIYPRTGSDFSISLALTPPYSLFDGRDYSDPNMSEQTRYGWIEYHKWKLKAQWFYPISTNQKLVIMAKAEMGYLGAYNKYKLSPFEGFDVGGDGMSGYNVYGVDVIGMRGYDNSSLNPPSSANDYSRVYNKYTMELRYPIILQQGTTIYALAFGEAGNGFANWKSFDPFEVKRSLGVGVRIYLPVVGMLGVDWAYGFDKVPGSTDRSGGHLHYSIGTQF